MHAGTQLLTELNNYGLPMFMSTWERSSLMISLSKISVKSSKSDEKKMVVYLYCSHK